ncbi:flagellar biosynthesis anti-sigma factor FlgM [Castellaniella sp. GW247-6E4]|uniref:flagellar biosynthesis anti-sigma factor FlgM n=1 Tax=Castellaniella sp. GW247-6E4 TaxID=3140380 RepID=UPI0033146D5F
MKISSTSSNSLLNGVTGGSRTEPGGGSPSQKSGGARSPVDLSPAARHLSALQDGGADIQAQRIQQIRDALASGELQINPGRIADGLLASVRDLLK